MANPYFRFKQFTVYHDLSAMKVTTDSCFFGAWAAAEIKDAEFKIKNLLDIGTGTALLSLMIAQKNVVDIEGVEIVKETSAQAKENVEASPWKDRIHIFNEDILSFHPNKKYDCIISNPPFYEHELASEVQTKNIAHHSEQLTISEILKFIRAYLNEDALFFLMFPFKRQKEIGQLLQQNELYTLHSVMLSQSVKHHPFRVIIKGSNKKAIAEKTTSISIWDDDQQYTKPFVELLKDYYLYL